MMKFKTLMMFKAFVCVILGIPILLLPQFFYSVFGVSLDAAGIFLAWEYGASLMGNALLTWYARHARESTGRRAIIRGMTVYNSIGFIVAMIAILTGVMNPLGWVAVAIYLFFALGFGYFWLKPPTP